MTRSMQRVAEAVAGDPAGCAALTVTGLAELTGTSEATVVRTARLLGYPGYRDLRLALAGLAAQQQSGRAPAITTDIAVDDPIADVVAKLAYDEQQTLADTAAGLDTVQARPSPHWPPPAAPTCTASAPPTWSPRISPSRCCA
ncbi:hypothetical protein STENM327S_08416 [Streptomyces tendae]